MKTSFIATLLLSFASLALAQSDVIPLQKRRSDDTLIAGFNTGAKTVKISATGTLEWVNGATLTGGSYLKTALGMGNVENTALSTWAGSTNVTTLGTITTGVWHGTPVGLAYLAAGGATDGQLLGFSDGAWVPVTFAQGLTVGTTDVAGGTSGRLLINNAGVLGELALGSGVNPALGNTVNASGGLLTYSLIGTSGTKIPLLDAGNTFSAAQIVDLAGGSTGSLLNVKVGGVSRFNVDAENGVTCGYQTSFGVGSNVSLTIKGAYGSIDIFPSTSGFTIGANIRAYGMTMADGSGLHRADLTYSDDTNHCLELRAYTDPNIFRVFNTFTSATNLEAFAIDWQAISNVCRVGAIAGSGGGMVRPVQYHTATTVFWSSGSGSPEGVVTAGIGSIYTRTDGGAGTTLYVKESGTGNTGWIAK